MRTIQCRASLFLCSFVWSSVEREDNWKKLPLFSFERSTPQKFFSKGWVCNDPASTQVGGHSNRLHMTVVKLGNTQHDKLPDCVIWAPFPYESFLSLWVGSMSIGNLDPIWGNYVTEYRFSRHPHVLEVEDPGCHIAFLWQQIISWYRTEARASVLAMEWCLQTSF